MGAFVEVNADNEIVTYPYTFSNLQAENPYTNFGDNKDVMYWFPQTNLAIENGYKLYPVFDTPVPSYNEITEYVQQAAPVEIDGSWFEVWVVNTNTPEQQAYIDARYKQSNKAQATQLLNQTDWTAIPSIADPLQSNPFLANQAAFLEYRNQIRQIAISPPVVAVWPPMPDEVWETVTVNP